MAESLEIRGFQPFSLLINCQRRDYSTVPYERQGFALLFTRNPPDTDRTWRRNPSEILFSIGLLFLPLCAVLRPILPPDDPSTNVSAVPSPVCPLPPASNGNCRSARLTPEYHCGSHRSGSLTLFNEPLSYTLP